MQLSKYISELLYRYECVIVPNFGGFVTNKTGASLHQHTFVPPYKNIGFNINLQQNDGLLANHIANVLNIDFESACELISKQVAVWNNELQNNVLILEQIGQFSLTNNVLSFEPFDKVNYLTSSFGLSEINANYILRAQQVLEKPTAKKPYVAVITAAAVASGLFFGGNYYKNYYNHQQNLVAQQKINATIQAASFNILEPLPKVRVTVAKIEKLQEVATIDKYQIIAGVFLDPKNAEKKVNQLKEQGYSKAAIVGVNKWGLTQVSYATFSNENDATNSLNNIKADVDVNAWMQVKE